MLFCVVTLYAPQQGPVCYGQILKFASFKFIIYSRPLGGATALSMSARARAQPGGAIQLGVN